MAKSPLVNAHSIKICSLRKLVVQVVQNNLLNDTYVLYQCGTAPPSLSQFPAGTKLFSIPLTSVSALETVPVAFLVGSLDKLSRHADKHNGSLHTNLTAVMFRPCTKSGRNLLCSFSTIISAVELYGHC